MQYCINYSITQYRIRYRIRYHIRSYRKKYSAWQRPPIFCASRFQPPSVLLLVHTSSASLSGERSPIAPHPDVDLKKPAACPAVWPGIRSRALGNFMTQRMRNSVVKAQYTISYTIGYSVQYRIKYCMLRGGLTFMASWREIPRGAGPGIGTGNPCSAWSNTDLSNEFQSGISDRNWTNRFSDPG